MIDIPVGCGNRSVAMSYFFSFIVVFTLIFLNLFIAIILQGFEDTNKKHSKLIS